MDAGTIIYVIVILFFAILGFFNKSKEERQAKNQGKDMPKPPVSIPSTIPEIVRKIQEAKDFKEIKDKRQPVPAAEVHPKHRSFSPSVSTIVSSIEGQSSLKGSLYVDDSLDGDDISEQSTPTVKGKQSPHSFIADLTGGDSQSELRKAVLYAEILNRKY